MNDMIHHGLSGHSVGLENECKVCAPKIIENLESERDALKNALEIVVAKQPEALEILRKNKFVFAGQGGRWEKLAFTFYTDLCELSSKAKAALAEGEDR